ncbi:MAG: hypothetical protein ABI823_10300 [Bryobacteraceae bacterium]
MSGTATQLRKELFTTLDRVTAGESVEISYKGTTIKLVSTAGSSKLSRAKRQHALLVDPDTIVGSDRDLQSSLEQKWAEDATKL